MTGQDKSVALMSTCLCILQCTNAGCVAQELQQHNIRVVAIYPHYVQSKMTDNAAVDSERLIRPNDIAEAALLPFRVSKHACPVKIVVENAVPVK